MKVLIISDSFKESLTQTDVIDTVTKALNTLKLDLDIKSIPLSDGGEGFVLSLSKILKLRILSGTSFDLLKRKIDVSYLATDSTTYFESSSVIGLENIPMNKRSPFNYDSYALGRLILEANTKNIVIGIGGTATVDGGLGLLRGMGATCFNSDGTEIKPEINNILEIETINLDTPREFFKTHTVTACYDVKNPYTGDLGSVNVFAKQKGATPKDLEILEKYFIHLNIIFKRDYGIDLNNIVGSGSGGGLLGVFKLLGAECVSGIEYVINKAEGKKKINSSDIIISGEGTIDSQSLRGKVLDTVSKLSVDKKVIAFTGINKLNSEEMSMLHIKNIIEISDRNMSLEYNLTHAKELLYNKVIENKKLFL